MDIHYFFKFLFLELNILCQRWSITFNIHYFQYTIFSFVQYSYLPLYHYILMYSIFDCTLLRLF